MWVELNSQNGWQIWVQSSFQAAPMPFKKGNEHLFDVFVAWHERNCLRTGYLSEQVSGKGSLFWVISRLTSKNTSGRRLLLCMTLQLLHTQMLKSLLHVHCSPVITIQCGCRRHTLTQTWFIMKHYSSRVHGPVRMFTHLHMLLRISVFHISLVHGPL